MIVEQWSHLDWFGLMYQLGNLPTSLLSPTLAHAPSAGARSEWVGRCDRARSEASGCTYLIGGYLATVGSGQLGAIEEELFDQIIATVRLRP